MQRDLTTRSSRLVSELRQLAQSYSHLFLRAADALLVWDADGKIRNANEAALMLSGYSREALIGERCFNLFPPEVWPLLENILHVCRGAKEGSVLAERETSLVTRQGERLMIMLRAAAVRLDKEPLVFGIVHDIRDLKELEMNISSSHALYRNIVEGTSDCVVVLDTEKLIRFVNAAAEKAFCLDRSNLIGKTLHRFVAKPEDRAAFFALLERSRTPGDNAEETLPFETPAGRQLEFAVAFCPMLDKAGARIGSLGILRNVTGHKELQEKALFAERMRSAGEILSSITHEVRNPLAAIHASAEFLRRHFDSADAAGIRQAAEIIASEADRLNGIISQFLKLRQIPKPNVAATDVAELVEAVTTSFSRVLEERPGLRTSVEIKPASVLVDASFLKQILWNLLNNSLEALSGDGSIAIVGRDVAERMTYILEVSDTGCGMTEQQVQRAFDPFFTTKEGGTGLGLALVKMQSESMGGSVDLISSPGEGTSVALELPLAAGREG